MPHLRVSLIHKGNKFEGFDLGGASALLRAIPDITTLRLGKPFAQSLSDDLIFEKVIYLDL